MFYFAFQNNDLIFLHLQEYPNILQQTLTLCWPRLQKSIQSRYRKNRNSNKPIQQMRDSSSPLTRELRKMITERPNECDWNPSHHQPRRIHGPSQNREAETDHGHQAVIPVPVAPLIVVEVVVQVVSRALKVRRSMCIKIRHYQRSLCYR